MLVLRLKGLGDGTARIMGCPGILLCSLFLDSVFVLDTSRLTHMVINNVERESDRE